MATADVLARVNGGTPTSINRAATATAEAPEMTAGEYIAELVRSTRNGVPEEFLERAARYIDRATMSTADATGILPSPIVGNVIKLADSLRPVFNSLQHPAMPDKGKTFQRPRITQRVTVGEQAAEGDALATQKMILLSDTVTKRTFGGTLDLTMQDIDWTEPSALQLVIQDFAEVYSMIVEGEACDFLEELIVAGDTAANGSTYSTYTTTDVGTIVGSYVTAIQAVYAKAKRFPDTVWLDLASWATLVTTFNTNKDVTALEMLEKALGRPEPARPASSSRPWRPARHIRTFWPSWTPSRRSGIRRSAPTAKSTIEPIVIGCRSEITGLMRSSTVMCPAVQCTTPADTPEGVPSRAEIRAITSLANHAS